MRASRKKPNWISGRLRAPENTVEIGGVTLGPIGDSPVRACVHVRISEDRKEVVERVHYYRTGTQPDCHQPRREGAP